MRKSVTLIEIIVSAIILGVAFTLLLSTFMATRRYSARANRRVVANNWVRGTSNYLYKEMVKNGAGSPSFSAGEHSMPLNDSETGLPNRSRITVDNVEYIGFYNVTWNGNNRNITFNVTYDSI